jgi:hypothetical protein
MSQTINMVIREIEKQIPTYEMRKIEGNFYGIYAKNKLVSVVSSEYKLIQSRQLFKELFENFKEFNILRYSLKTNLKKHFLYIRFENPPFSYKFLVVAVNSIDKSNALKLFVGVYEQYCGNDLLLTHAYYIKHIGEIEEKLKINLSLDYVIQKYEALKKRYINLSEEDLEKLRKVVFLKDYDRKYLLNTHNLFDIYQYITTILPKKYNIAYFEKLNNLYNFLIKE